MKASESKLLTTWGIMDAERYTPQAFVPYLVYVRGRGWTDGEYRTDGPLGWCHKWALDNKLRDGKRRGVTHFCQLPPSPQLGGAR